MPNNRVRGVIRTRDGFIWLATDGGAVRFDGMNFTVFGLRERLLAPIVLSIRETSDGALWFGRLGGGLCVFRKGGIEQTYTTADGLPPNWVMTASIARRVTQSFKKERAKTAETDSLSPREVEVLELSAKGFAYKEVAGDLSISYSTVQRHIESIYRKLHVHSRQCHYSTF